MNFITFSRPYSKLRGQKSAVLISARYFNIYEDTFPAETIKYDTDNTIPFESGEYIQLVFIGDKQIPFTTYRKSNKENSLKYIPHINDTFTILVRGKRYDA